MQLTVSACSQHRRGSPAKTLCYMCFEFAEKDSYARDRSSYLIRALLI